MTLVYLAGIPYRFLRQRPQELCTWWARLGEDVVYVGAPRKGWANRREIIAPESGPGVLRVIDVQSPIPTFRAQSAMLTKLKFRMGGRVEAASPLVVIIGHPRGWKQRVKSLGQKPDLLIYDVADDIKAISYDARTMRNDLRDEETLLQHADLCVFVTRQAVKNFGGRAVYLPNGVADELLAETVEAASHPAGTGKVGYLGAIAPWLDLSMVEEAARRLPQALFELAGPVTADVSGLRALPNVEFLGEVKPHDRTALLSTWDAALMPFMQTTEILENVNPLKLFEYSAAGLPVISTPLTDIVQDSVASDLVYVATSPTGFAEQVAATLADHDPAVRARRRAFAEDNAWSARAREYRAIITSKLESTGATVVTR